jgi:hypothetical protein
MDKINNIIARSFKFLILGVSFVLYTLSFPLTCLAKDISFEVTVDRGKVSLGSSLQLALSFNNAIRRRLFSSNTAMPAFRRT